MKAIAVLLALLVVGCKPIPPKPEPETPTWLTVGKESEEERPDSPEQVLITIRTRDGKRWVATWEELPSAPNGANGGKKGNE